MSRSTEIGRAVRARRRRGAEVARSGARVLAAWVTALLLGATSAGSAFADGAPAKVVTKTVGAAKPWQGLGRPATPAEVAAWDIDVRADFKGLPPGRGSVDEGMDVWEGKCASCHGVFGESNEVFTPIAGGTTAEDIRAGRVASLRDPSFPQRTTLMKLSRLSTLWDYVNRAMPWNAPKSLSTNEVYAVVAYILHLGEILPADFVLSNENIAQVQERLPNRHGKVAYAGLWDVKGKPDVQGDACMTNCRTALDVRSFLPSHARDAHGNLQEQNRIVGPVRGAVTTESAPAAPPVAAAPVTRAESANSGAAALARESNCFACHAVDAKMVGPAFREVAKRYQGDAKALEVLSGRVKNGAQGAWGQIPMPGNGQVSDENIREIVRWILAGAT